MIGISQFFTITFFLVGWFWSITWGGLLIIYSVQYREALQQRRQEAMTHAAVKALSKNSIIRTKQVRKLMQSNPSTTGTSAT
ncbi:unnamed protein product [Cylicocyclus nassatus]|uniref:Uncharacterized protein n=1 Tax=Cylicocyclus nassatus TaxID=53992 RepID=A0AA36GK62_CYLNA|nr:unnamed protein product [Cylicocyclus nassatus]